MEKTIEEKLKLHGYDKKAVLNRPSHHPYLTELTEVDEALNGSYDLIFDFVETLEQLVKSIENVKSGHHLNEKGYLFIAYPKKDNKQFKTYVHRDDILKSIKTDAEGYVPGSSLKFSRMVKLDDIYTIVGLKQQTVRKKSTASSQRVKDYIDDIPKIEEDLADVPKELAFYQSLTPGYKKDWARYVYSAKQEATREKRRQEMKEILSLGFKTKELYRQGK
ncbi:MAG TPA: YdeI/OmpD-associated family protein [Kurthia sp.]